MKLHHGFPMCKHHRPVDLPYLQWHEWAEKKHRAGERQRRCKKCNRVFFKEEFGDENAEMRRPG